MRPHAARSCLAASEKEKDCKKFLRVVGLHHFLKSDALIMATKKPRITISLNEQDYAVLKRLNSLNGVPMSRTISELVGTLTPVLERMADNLEAVVKADEETRRKIANSLEKHFLAASSAYDVAMENFDDFSDSLQEIAQRNGDGGMRVPRGRGDDSLRDTPDCVTRGSGTERETGSGGQR